MNKYCQAKNLEDLLQIEYGKRGTEKADVNLLFYLGLKTEGVQLSTLIKILNGMWMTLQIIKNEGEQDMFISVS